MNKIIVTSGGFDPIHSGHVKLMNSAKTYGDYLIVGVNSNAWLERKKGKSFMPFNERAAVVANMKAVDEVMAFNDDDGSACDLLEKVKKMYPMFDITFANGGDRTAVNIPEMKVEGVKFIFGVGGEDKTNSSSWILQEWKAPKTEKQWGYYRVLHEVPGCKVKELTVLPGKSLSMQRHFKRNEYWLVTEGEGHFNTRECRITDWGIALHDTIEIKVGDWHQLSNTTDTPLRIIEIQYGGNCVEEDIERLDNLAISC